MEEKIIIYDFDGTLTPYKVPIYPIMKKALNQASVLNTLRMVIKQVNTDKTDVYKWYYKMLFNLLEIANIPLIKENLCYGAKSIKYHPGVIEYLKSIRSEQPNIKHIILTSGLEDFVKATDLSNLVDDIYGTKFNYVDDEIQDEMLLSAEKKPVIIDEITDGSCNNVIYLGDGLTDSLAFKYVKQSGGKSVLVGSGKDVKEILNQGIVDKYFDADYTVGSKLYKFLRYE